MPFMTAAKNVMLDALAIDAVSLHSADPGTTGTSEIAGGGYARLVPTFAAASGSERVLSSALVFSVQGGDTAAYAGYWDGAVFFGKQVLSPAEVFAGDGTLTLTTAAKLSLTD